MHACTHTHTVTTFLKQQITNNTCELQQVTTATKALFLKQLP